MNGATWLTRQSFKPRRSHPHPHYGSFLNAWFSSRRGAYDVAVIGGGPGGYVAAIKAAQLQLKTVCIERRGVLGGTCLNVGCIPSKTLLNISQKYHEAKHEFSNLGISIGSLDFNLEVMQRQKDKVVNGLTQGIEFLFKKNKVDYVKGSASFSGNKAKLRVDLTVGGSQEIDAKRVIIASGSEPAPFPGGAIVPDEVDVVTSTGALCFNAVPRHLVVIGGGVIGLELGSVWARLGAKVSVVEFLNDICPNLDKEVTKAFLQTLKKQGLVFHLGTRVVTVERRHEPFGGEHDDDGGGGVLPLAVRTERVGGGSKGETGEILCDKVLVAVGRRPYTKGLGLERLGVKVDPKSQCIEVDEQLKVIGTEGIYAIGDVIRGPMLAHKAEEEGIAVAESLAKELTCTSSVESDESQNKQQAGVDDHPLINYNAIPSVVYTHPEVAGVGRTEEEIVSAGVPYKKSVFPFMANSRARANYDAEGFVKILTNKDTDRILGAWILGTGAGENIAELALAVEYGASSEDVGRTCHAHPTLSEAVKEACLGGFARPIHSA